MKKIINRFEDFVKGISEKDKIALLHHTDQDGICSAVIAAKAIERVKNKKIDLILNQGLNEITITEDTIKVLRRYKINKAIIVDLAVDQNPSTVKQLEKFCKLLIIDHHRMSFDLNNKQTILIKAEHISKLEGGRYPAAKMCFDLFSRLTNLTDLDWIAALGILGDKAHESWKEFISGISKKYNQEVGKDIYKTALGEISECIMYSVIYNLKNVKRWFERIYNAKNYKDLPISKKYEQIIKKELNFLVKKFEDSAEFYPEYELSIYRINLRFPFFSLLSSKLGLAHPHKTLIIIQDSNNFLDISARRFDRKIAVNKLMEDALRNLKQASGGGHAVAAGGKIRKEDFEKFKEEVINYFKLNKTKRESQKV